MSDLRDRIASVLFRQRGHSHGWDDETEACREMWRRDADAVIRELGLKRADGPLRGTPVHRYITEWEPNE